MKQNPDISLVLYHYFRCYLLFLFVSFSSPITIQSLQWSCKNLVPNINSSSVTRYFSSDCNTINIRPLDEFIMRQLTTLQTILHIIWLTLAYSANVYILIILLIILMCGRYQMTGQQGNNIIRILWYPINHIYIKKIVYNESIMLFKQVPLCMQLVMNC